MSILNFFRNRNKAGKDRYILCIDGGGMRGVIPALVLQKLESIMRTKGADGALQNYFDLIAGTSTGGLIASSIVFPDNLQNTEYRGTKQIDFKFLEDTYMTIGQEIFPTGSILKSIVTTPYQVVANKYSVSGLENLLDLWFKDRKLSEAKVPTLIMAYNLSCGKEALLKSYDSNGMTVKQACRATSAAPTYFAPLVFNNELYADGGVTANNPSLYAYLEARKLYPDCRKFHILSIGTGAQVHRTDADAVNGLINWIEQISPMYLTAQKQTTDHVMNSLPDVDYLRVNRELDETIKMDDAREKSMKTLQNFGRALADEFEDKLKEFAAGQIV